jgi:16S rRNA (adenine1518-N6/adenine1519-N6)-dimethyltransferase
MDMNVRTAAPDAATAKGFVPNKALGQNFLTDELVIRSILDAADCEGKIVLEIGPGTGALTQGLLERAKRVSAVEKDGRLCVLLTERFGERLTLLHADFLEADIESLVEDRSWHAVGNLPYYATTPIVLKLLSLLPESMTLMVQKEAAERFFAEPGDRVYGPLSVMTRCFYTAKPVLNVPRSCFSPAPEVDSTVIRLERNDIQEQDPAAYLAFLKQAFSMRRKTLYNSLMRDIRLPDALLACQVPQDARAEALPAKTLLRLYRTLQAQ